jgi:mRNA-degrading endonuclease RelE of RelBE toxin-antitoxin system
MLDVEFSSVSAKFLKKANKELLTRLIDRIERLADVPFPSDVKRVVNRQEKIFRIRVGDYRIQYIVIPEKNLLFVTDIDKRDRAYD